MLKKIHAAREFSIMAAIKRTLYRQGKTTAVTLVSRAHLMEALDRVLFIFGPSVDLEHRRHKNAEIQMLTSLKNF